MKVFRGSGAGLRKRKPCIKKTRQKNKRGGEGLPTEGEEALVNRGGKISPSLEFQRDEGQGALPKEEILFP